MTRTLLLICVCWLFVCAGSTGGALNIIKHIWANPFIVNISKILAVGSGMSMRCIALSLFGVLLLIVEHYLTLKYTSVVSFINKKNFFLKWSIIYFIIGMIFKFGLVGESEFIYNQF